MAYFACQNLGISKENRDFGPTLYQNFKLNTCQNLGGFIRTIFFDAKNPMAYFPCLNLGTFKENNDFGPTFYQNVK